MAKKDKDRIDFGENDPIEDIEQAPEKLAPVSNESIAPPPAPWMKFEGVALVIGGPPLCYNKKGEPVTIPEATESQIKKMRKMGINYPED